MLVKINKLMVKTESIEHLELINLVNSDFLKTKVNAFDNKNYKSQFLCLNMN